MVNKGVVLAGAIGGIAAVSIAAYLSHGTSGTTGSVTSTVPVATLTPTSTLSRIVLTGPSSANSGQSVQFQATAYDNNNQPFPGALLTLHDATTGANGSMGTTDGNGVAIADVTVSSAGKFTFYAEG